MPASVPQSTLRCHAVAMDATSRGPTTQRGWSADTAGGLTNASYGVSNTYVHICIFTCFSLSLFPSPSLSLSFSFSLVTYTYKWSFEAKQPVLWAPRFQACGLEY